MKQNKNALSRAAYLLSIITALTGVLVLIGWQFDNYTLKTFGFGGITMKVNTAISFIFIGLAVIFLQQKDQKIKLYLARIFSLATLLLGALVFSQYIFSYNLGIDELLFHEDPNAINTVHPGRMAPNTCLNFIFAGLSLILISFNKTKNSLLTIFFLTIVLCISIFGVLGHIFGVTGLTWPADFIKMALNTSLLFIAISIALFFTIYHDSKLIMTMERKLFVAVTIAMIIILFVSANSIMSIQSLIAASNNVQQSELVKSELTKIQAETYEMAADIRGFIITNNEKFIADWNESKTNILTSIQSLKAFTKANPTQQKTLITLNQLLNERFDFSELSIQLMKTESPKALSANLTTLKGSQIMGEIIAIISKMEEEENRQLTLLHEYEDNNAGQTLTIIALSIVIQLILLAFIFLFVSKDLSGKRKAQQELQTVLGDLEKIVVERTTDLKASNEKIIMERDKAHQYFDIAGVILIVLNKTGKVAKINIKGCEVFGCAENEIVGKDYFETFLPKNIADESRVMYKGLMNGSIEAIEFYENPVLNKNGEERIIEWHNVILRDANGNPNGTLSSGEDITERKISEEKIRESEQRFQNAFEYAAVGMTIIALNGLFLRVNDRLINMLGFSEEELLSKTFQEITYLDDLPLSLEKMRQLLSGEISSYVLEKRYHQKSGQIIWALLSVSLVKDKNGQAIYFIAQIQDITESKLAEEKIRESEQRFRMFLENISVGVVVHDLQSKITFANSIAQDLLGLLNEDLIGRDANDPVWYFINENGSRIGVPDYPVNKVLSSKKPIKDLIIGLTSDSGNKTTWIQLNGLPQFNSNNELTEVIISFSDITERKIAKEKILNLNAELEYKVKERTEQLTKTNENLLKEMNERTQIENRFKVVVESAPNAIILVDKKGKIQMINKQTENYFGYNREELIGNKIELLVPGANKLDDINLRTTFTNQPSEHTIGAKHNFFGIKKDGTEIPIEMHLNPIHIQNETLILTSIIDITERKKAEEAIKKAKNEADQANHAKSEFLSRMSHELRTPLNSILGFTQLMGMGELNPEHKKGIDHIMKSGKHLLNLVNEVLDLSRIEAGKLSVSLETVELNGIILEILDVVHPLAKENKIKIEFENVKTQQLFVKADHQKLKQVLLNIINNAIKYNNEGGSVTITATNVKNKNARISVTDTGNGIHKDELQKLFMPFQRIGKEISEVEGTGLGLAISKKLTEAMNGNIGVESEVGKGSTFWIELPQSNGLMESHHLEIDFEALHNNKNNFAGTLLYIEDNISNQQLIKQIMDTYRSNINLITGLYGRDAVKMAQDYKPNLILLDLNLPDIHGSQVLELLQKNAETEKIPVVILSADATDTQMKKLLKAGATTYLTKPLDVIEFLKVIDETMNDG